MGMTRKGTGRIGAGEPSRRWDRRMAGDPAVRDAAHRIESGLAVKRADRVARPGNQHADGVPGTQQSTQWIGNGVLDNSLEDESLLCEFVGAPVSEGGVESLVVGPPHIVVEVGA